MRKLGRAVSAVCGVVSQALHGAAEGGREEGAGGADEEEISHSQPQRQASAFFLRHSRCGTGILSHLFARLSTATPFLPQVISHRAAVRFSLLTLLHPYAASASVNIGQLEQQLILLLEPRRIRQTLIELHGMAERPFWRVNSKVRIQQTHVRDTYCSQFKAGDISPQSRDLVHK